MQVSYTTANGRLTVILEGETQTDIFEKLAQFQEVFENTTCTKKVNGQFKSSDDVKFVVRKATDEKGKKEYKYFELHCTSKDPDLRGARLSFGQHQEGGTMFPKRKNDKGEWLPDNGWCKYDKDSGVLV